MFLYFYFNWFWNLNKNNIYGQPLKSGCVYARAVYHRARRAYQFNSFECNMNGHNNQNNVYVAL